MIIYWEIHVGLIPGGPGTGKWSYGVKAWRQGEANPLDNWSGTADTESAAWESVHKLQTRIRLGEYAESPSDRDAGSNLMSLLGLTR